MDRMEILKLALATNADPEKALDLASRMAAFVAGDVPAPAAPPPAAVFVQQEAQTQPQAHKVLRKRMGLIAPGVMGFKAKEDKTPRPARSAKLWTEDERLEATLMLDEGQTFQAVAQRLDRTAGAVEKAWRDGLLPCKIQHHTQQVVK